MGENVFRFCLLNPLWSFLARFQPFSAKFDPPKTNYKFYNHRVIHPNWKNLNAITHRCSRLRAIIHTNVLYQNELSIGISKIF